MIQRIALAGIAAGAAAFLLGVAVGGAPGTAMAAAAALALPVALAALGAVRRGALGGAGAGLLALLALLEVSGLSLLLLPPSGPAERTLLGLPLRLAVFLGGVWLLPMIVALATYAGDLGRRGITDADLERLRRLRAESRDGEPAGLR